MGRAGIFLKIIITERLTYPEKSYTHSYELPKGYSIPKECFALKYEHHFWVNIGSMPKGGDVCICGKETLEDDYQYQ